MFQIRRNQGEDNSLFTTIGLEVDSARAPPTSHSTFGDLSAVSAGGGSTIVSLGRRNKHNYPFLS